MTRQETLEKLPLITAYANGKIIQYRFSPGCIWEDIGHPTWTEPADHYRIKPEPREFEIYISPKQRLITESNKNTEHLKDSGWEQIRVREILD